MFIGQALDYARVNLIDYIDIDFTLWLTWLLTPLIITFLLPLVILLLFYLTAIILYIYKYRDRLRNAYEQDFWDGARKTVAALWDAHGWVWHGYEIEGLENVPEGKPCLFVYYHSTIPVDIYYFIARYYLLRNKVVHTVADRFLFKVPGWSIISEGIKVIPGTVQSCAAILKAKESLAIAPGGVYEAQFGSHVDYRLMWKERVGFARVAIMTSDEVVVIPMFTENIRESFRNVSFGRKFWLWLYHATRLPFVPIYGGFPVKLVTHLGRPVPVQEGITPRQFSVEVAKAIDDLIETHQKLPGSIMRALYERIHRIPKTKSN
uniref:Putative phosphate acyltransferase n=1 Tax=Triatoma infestans TaxID=30076 RepID=A0A023F8P3_TRIIF